MRVLHIVATPRSDASNTLRVSKAFLGALAARHQDAEIETIDLYRHDLPAVAGQNIENKYLLMGGASLDDAQSPAWESIEDLITSFKAADVHLISSPMWNFSIPYALKYYIDAIVQPGYLFRYDEQGRAIGLVEGKRMVCVTTRGGDYSPGSPFHAYDFQEPYLRAIFGFVGIEEIEFVNAQPMDITPQLREQAVAESVRRAEKLAVWATEIGHDGTAEPSPAELKPRPLQQ
ncbi:MAG: NAD(P)H-dependent oxidoreductase [Acidimicrobiia bacterium]|nr:NAD(P)H-dependent oxidoreductase [Acidimicrobiia bacterium]